VVDILRGADTEAIRQRKHNELSTYGIGGDVKRGAWQAIGRELLRMGLLECASGKFATLSLTPAGRDALRRRLSITLTKQVEVASQPRDQKPRPGAIECDEVLFERLRRLRRKVADERNVPAYVIFSDVSLREMARTYPTTAAEFRRVPGVGEQKLKDFAEVFLHEVKTYLAAAPRRTFSSDSLRPRPARRSRLNDSQRETLRLFRSGQSVNEISRTRGLVRNTIFDHLYAAITSGEPLEPSRFFTAMQREEIAAAFRKVPDKKLADVRALLDGKYDYGELRIFRALCAH
jgi:ATP-dependent DNA helicase RecQ